jgi:hypothetical protein
MNNLPKVTRLRYVTAKSPDDIVQWLTMLGRRVQIYGSPVWDGKRWWLWFVPDDRGGDIPSVKL